MKTLKSTTMSDEFWQRAEPLIPKPRRERRRKYLRRAEAGRKVMDPRKELSAIVYVLRTGCDWKALPRKEFASARSVHKYFLE
jgi:putative transposase